MFNDRRSKRVILVAHCLLNQNAKLDACAHYPGAMKEVAQLLVASGVGIVQLPCPELAYLGLDRQVAPGTAPSVASEDSRIARRMGEDSARSTCEALIEGIVRLQEKIKAGVPPAYEIRGVAS